MVSDEKVIDFWQVTYLVTYQKFIYLTMKVSDLDPKHLDIEVSASSGDIWISGGEIEEARPTKKRLNLGFPVIGVFSSSKSGLRRHQFKTYPADHFTGRRGEHTVQDYFKICSLCSRWTEIRSLD